MRTPPFRLQLGGLSLGLNAYAGDRNDGGLKEKLRDALGRHELVVNYLERENPGTWEVDRMLLDYAVLEAGCGGEDRLMEKSLAFLESLKTEAGTLAYRRGQPAVRYVDTIGLGLSAGGGLRGAHGAGGILEPCGKAGGGIRCGPSGRVLFSGPRV